MVSLQILKPDFIRISEIEAEVKQGIHGNDSRFTINEEYQRSTVWKKEKELALLDTILKDLSVGVLFFRKLETNKLEVLDGQQRINAIRNILKWKLFNPRELAYFNTDKSLARIKPGSPEYLHFLDFQIWYIPVVGESDQEVSELFLKLQEGLPLIPAEKLNAQKSNLRNYVKEAASHELFRRKELRISPYRFGHRYLVAQATYLLRNSDWSEPTLVNPARERDLRDMYEEFRSTPFPARSKRGVNKVLTFLNDSLGQDIKAVRESDFLIVFALAHYVKREYVVNKEIFKEFVTVFITEVETAPKRDLNSRKLTSYEEYKLRRTGGATQKNYQRRFELMLREFHRWKRLKRKDEDRFFTWAQKLDIYYKKDKGKCANCGDRVDWKDATFDHVERHSRGGKTITVNGRLVHAKCHAEWENKKSGKKVPSRTSGQIENQLRNRENTKVERKSTFRIDLGIGVSSKVMEKGVAKTVAAFLNSEGGTLYIGVDDNGNALGLEPDYSILKKPNTDGFELELRQSLEKFFKDKIVNELTKVEFLNMMGSEICQVTLPRSPKPIVLHDEGKEEFYVRVGNSSKPYTATEFLEYAKRRFKGYKW